MAERSVNLVILLGRLGKDAEQRFTPSGAAVCNFSIATSTRYKDGQGEWTDKTEWHNIVLWNSEKVSPYLLKGVKVHITGRLQTRSWEQNGVKRYTTEIICSELILLGGNEGQGDSGRAPAQRQPPARQQQRREPPGARSQAPNPDEYSYNDDDVPF